MVLCVWNEHDICTGQIGENFRTTRMLFSQFIWIKYHKNLDMLRHEMVIGCPQSRTYYSGKIGLKLGIISDKRPLLMDG